ncbi:MAG TPA: hypothetical protein VE869_03640, partial [Gemmatimonas sp.]|nr:hypothetical protein [Gemmatimonas sp.]
MAEGEEKLETLFYDIEGRTEHFDASIQRVRAQIKALEDLQLSPVQLTADASKAEATIDRVQKQLDAVAEKPAAIEVTATTAEAERSLDELSKKVTAIATPAPVKIAADTTAAESGIGRVTEKVADLGADKPIALDFAADTAAAELNVGSLSQQVGALAVRTGLVSEATVASAATMAAAWLGPALAVALVVRAVYQIGDAAFEAATSVERAVVPLENSLGITGKAAQSVREDIRALSDRSGEAQEAVAGIFEAAAENGAQGAAAVRTITTEVLRLKDAVGGDGVGLAKDLERVVTGFAIDASRSGLAAAAIVSSAQGVTDAKALLAVVGDLAPAAQRAGLSFETTTAAVVRLVQEGRTIAEASSEVARLAERGEEGRVALQALGAEGVNYAQSVIAYESAQANATTSADRLTATLKNKLRNELVDLGQSLLPLAYIGLSGINGVLEQQGPLWQRVAIGMCQAAFNLAKVNDETERGSGLSAAD